MTRKVIFDTDPGIDDAMALLLIEASPALDLVGITTVFGNADVDTTTRNAHYLAERFGIAAPVRRGAAQPIESERRPAPVHIHGENGLGAADLSHFGMPTPHPESAAEFLVRMASEMPGELTVIAVGPLTNLALALRLAPELAGQIREVIVMGGAFGYGGRRGNVSPVAEANIANDPEAADLVFTASWPVTVVGLDVTAECILRNATAAQMAEQAGEAGQFLYEISRSYAAMYKHYDGIDGCCLHDVAAVIRATDPDLFETVEGPLRVAIDGIARGQTIQRPLDQSFPPGAWDDVPAQRVCRTVTAGAVERLFVERMITHSRVPAS
ncbi:MAG: nucleoside hydrolase [Sphingomonadales bacterium]|nr:MAG: nucleoside hydrolase [Sphingomonadales bacterium]